MTSWKLQTRSKLFVTFFLPKRTNRGIAKPGHISSPVNNNSVIAFIVGNVMQVF